MLIDRYRRNLDCLRISLTDKCNLNCVNCAPPTEVIPLLHEEILRNEEIILLVSIFSRMGIAKIRFTGGEPLMRNNFHDILKAIHDKHPEILLCLTTNGVLLGKHLEELMKSGVRKINISLDTLSKEWYNRITGENFCSLDKLLAYLAVMSKIKRDEENDTGTAKMYTYYYREHIN